MVRRWLIRGLFMLLCILCVAAWVGSYFESAYVQYIGGERMVAVRAECDSLFLSVSNDPGYVTNKWDSGLAPAEHSLIQAWYRDTDFHSMGFAYRRILGATPAWQVWVPLWFPAFLCGLLTWFAWRKARVKRVGGAFPVEFAKGSGDAD